VATQEVFGAGGEVPVRDVLHTVFTAAWVGAMPTRNPDGYSLYLDLGQAIGTSSVSRMLRIGAPDPRMREAVRELLGDMTGDLPLDSMPIERTRFADWSSGPLSGLSEGEQKWVTAQVPRALEFWKASRDIASHHYAWLESVNPGELCAQTRYSYELTIGIGVPYREFDIERRMWTPAPVPDQLYDELGASRERPVYCVESRTWVFY